MDNRELQKLTEDISLTYFKLPFMHDATFNPRLKTTGGRYLTSTSNIEINKKYYDALGMSELIGIIKHELCHYHLHIRGKGYKHRDQDFKMLLKAVGAPRFCTPIKTTPAKPKAFRLYECVECQQTYKRIRKVNINKYRCGKCRGMLREIKNKVDIK
ncbi:SprT family protein [Sutcliffiella rhizosphaerae]|uniref:Protein SprT-like n=1 Tax=Sutcliffiella rhizosphaerae TaxID=2880967 RepID=A0ABM8YTU8_9BACI|nr:SprT family protein [Sutcliffiella rhizosphaerae]CAG9623386.1 Protein SprT-like protein [Sutcliffiella rhizosphaerae]